MGKWAIAYTEKLYYLTTEVTAKSEEEAQEKFDRMMENGDIPVANSEMIKYEVRKLKP
jgi:hypothetical protein